MAGQFRSSVWDPILIIAQIITFQCVFYLSFGFWISIMNFIAGTYCSLEQFFSFEVLQFKDLQGKLLMVAYILNALTSAGGLWYVVQRTKQCWDFAATAHVSHLLACCLYNARFPQTLLWWLCNSISVVIMTVLGEFLCMRTELRVIPLSVGPKADL